MRAAYRDQTSNEVVVRSTSAAPVTLALKAARDVLLVGESGKLALTGGDDKARPTWPRRGATFEAPRRWW